MTMSPGQAASESSATAKSFGAQISLADHGQALFYVVARAGSPDAALRSVGGEVMSRLSPSQALGLAPLSAHADLRHHPDLELAGPITIDPQRFERFTRLIGVGGRRWPAESPST
jgi:hypothetical protein